MIVVKSMYCARSRNTIAVESRNADQFGVEERKIKRERERESRLGRFRYRSGGEREEEQRSAFGDGGAQNVGGKGGERSGGSRMTDRLTQGSPVDQRAQRGKKRVVRDGIEKEE